MLNIRFNYFYRDADNYKLFGSEVVSNEQGLRIPDVRALINRSLIDEQYFYPSEWRLPLLHLEDGWGMEETDGVSLRVWRRRVMKRRVGVFRSGLKRSGSEPVKTSGCLSPIGFL